MTTHDRIPEARLTAGLSDLAGPSTPGLREEILAATARKRQRPAWSFIERWLPMAVIARPVAAPALRPLWLLIVALLLAVLAVGGAIVGASLLRSDAVVPTGREAVYAFSSVAAEGDWALNSQQVMTIRPDGSDLRQLTGGGANQRLPQFSPDGTRIAVRQWQAGTESIAVMDAGGGDPMTLATYETPRLDCIGDWEVAWSPDGSALAYAIRDGCSQRSRIDIVSTNGGSLPVPLLASDLDATGPDWSPDGTRIAFAGGEVAGTWGLYVAATSLPDALSGGLVPQRLAAGLGGPVGRPRWSPDRSEIAVTMNSSPDEFEGDAIYAVSEDGSTQRMVIERAHNPEWSPDGQKLGFARTVDPSEFWKDRPCTVRIGTVDVDGSHEQLLDPLGDGCDFAAQFSPDGTLLAALLIASTSEAPELAFHLGFVPIDGVTPPVIVQDSQGGSWQPVAAPLPPAPSFPGGSATP